MLTTVYAHDIMDIIHSSHKSPHYILGMHMVEVPVKNKKESHPSVRAFLPDAKCAFVVDPESGNRWEMEKVHDGGLFEGIIWDRKEKFHYKLAVESQFGHSWEMEDPYEE